MESMTSSCSVSAPRIASNYDELVMQQSSLFADSLKDLKDLRKQLYSAADYFELSYHKDDHKDLTYRVVETLKDYVSRAFISTVDHLGSVAFKVNNFLDEKNDQVARAKLQISCIERRLRTCEESIDRGGLSQQSLIIRTPRYHKRYTFPEEIVHSTGRPNSMYSVCISCPENDSNQRKKAVQEATGRQSNSPFRKRQSGLLSTEASGNIGYFSFTRVATNREPGKRAVSPVRFSLKRSGFAANVSITRSSSNAKQRYSTEPRRSLSMCIQPETEGDAVKEMEQYSNRSKQFLKAMFSMQRSRKEGLPYRYTNR